MVPEPEWLDYPSLLDLPRPRLRAYRPETVVAEKLHAMVVLGEVNSRMRDFFDVDALAARMQFDGEPLVRALRETFERRRTPIPESLPLALTAEFAEVYGKREQWAAFLRKNGLTSSLSELDVVISRIATFLEPVLVAARSDLPLRSSWVAGGPWEGGS